MFSLFLLAAVATHLCDCQPAGDSDPSGCGERCRYPHNCEDVLLQDPRAPDGNYTVFLRGDPDITIVVKCDMKNGGWTILLDRFDGSASFNRNWEEMKRGFSSSTGEYWMGLEDIYRITDVDANRHHYALRIDIGSHSHHWIEAYDFFYLQYESREYSLHAYYFNDTVSTNEYSALGAHTFQRFSTIDRDNDRQLYKNCAQIWQSPGWYLSDCDNWYVIPFGPYTSPLPWPYVPKRTVWNVIDYIGNHMIYPTELRWKIRRQLL